MVLVTPILTSTLLTHFLAQAMKFVFNIKSGEKFPEASRHTLQTWPSVSASMLKYPTVNLVDLSHLVTGG